MWLPKDERKLLAFYYAKAGSTDQNLRFEQHVELMKVLGFDEKPEAAQITEQKFDMVLNANQMLKDRGLINLRYETQQLIVNVSLTLKGCDLGRKYSTRPGRAWVCLNEYKVWVILGAITGLAGLIVSILVAGLKE